MITKTSVRQYGRLLDSILNYFKRISEGRFYKMCVLTKQISQTIGNENFFVSTLPHLCEAKLISFGIIYCSYQYFFLSIYFVHSFQGYPGVFNFKGRRNFPLLIWSHTLKCQCINLIGINFISPTLQVARLGKFRSIISLCKITN